MNLSLGIALLLSVYQGFISMGFQLVGSRLLYPYFGSSVIVWAFLISTFLAAFSVGSVIGGFLTRLSVAHRNGSILVLVVICTIGFLFPAIWGRDFLIHIADRVDSTETGLLIATPTVFFLPVMALSAFPSLLADSLDKIKYSTGMASGLIFGFSTVGNISGVMSTVFFLIPKFAVSSIITGWFIAFTVLGILFLVFLVERG